MNEQEKDEMSQNIVDDLKKKDLLERDAVSILRRSISIIDSLRDRHVLR